METLRINEIFYSLQGETRTVGVPTVFVRLTGCPLRCSYCDTAYAFHQGSMMTLENILAHVKSYSPRFVTVTGGEPLAQKLCLKLLNLLCDEGYEVSLETSGALSIRDVDSRVIKVMDLKTPSSGESHNNLFENISHLQSKDQLKFVLCDRQDYDWAKTILVEHQLQTRCEILFSPSYNQLNNQVLADWIIADNLPVRFQIQLHKYIWGDVPGK